MKTKLLIVALLSCSSLSLAGGDPSTAPAKPKKAMKVLAPSTSSSTTTAEAQPTLGGLGTGGLGTGSSGTAAPKKMRGTAPAPTR